MYQKFNEKENAAAAERRELAVERLKEIGSEETVEEPLREPFRQMASYLLTLDGLASLQQRGVLRDADGAEWKRRNDALYGEVLDGRRYEASYLNPAYAVKCCGREAGQMISFLYSELQAGAGYAYEGRIYALVLLDELVIAVYNCLEHVPVGRVRDSVKAEFSVEEEGGAHPERESAAVETEKEHFVGSPELRAALREARDTIYWYFHDYSEIFAEWQVREMVDPDYDYCTDILMNSDLSDLNYLYYYGLPIGENERKTAEFLNTLPEKDIQAMAETYTEGYRIGFVTTGKDLSRKRTVQLRYAAGLERMMRAAVRNFEAMGLRPTISLEPFSSFQGKCVKNGVYVTGVNRQFEFDHREDKAFYFDKSFVERRMESLTAAFEKYRVQAGQYGGPAVVEVFGEEPFSPQAKQEALHFGAEQQELNVRAASMSGQITNEYIPGEERSFTIISWPVPEIGEQFEDIFRETVKINTLDYRTWQRMQQKLIDVLDQASYVEVKGKDGNETDLAVRIHPLEDPAHQTAFENCVADVNIPVGEVFTSPVLEGTHGLLHISEVFLNGLEYKDLKIWFKDGMVAEYSCRNFDSDEENRKYIRDNVLMHHETLPMGEFAIGTNTAAYRMGKKYGIMDRLPILIAEKCGPHFAVGDTCYSQAEDTPVYNPDGKEIVSRDNSVSILRKEDPAKAYFNCHTDITIPYNELDTITAVRADGARLPVIADGKFAVPGTEELNRPLEEE